MSFNLNKITKNVKMSKNSYCYFSNCPLESIEIPYGSKVCSIFYEYKNESMDALADDELIEKMQEAFNGECQGSTDYLEETILEELARNIRVGGERFLRESRRRRAVEDDII